MTLDSESKRVPRNKKVRKISFVGPNMCLPPNPQYKMRTADPHVALSNTSDGWVRQVRLRSIQH